MWQRVQLLVKQLLSTLACVSPHPASFFAEAETLVSQLEVKLVRVVDFQESAQFPYYRLEESVAMGGGAPEIEPGENKISVSVTITYQIR